MLIFCINNVEQQAISIGRTLPNINMCLQGKLKISLKITQSDRDTVLCRHLLHRGARPKRRVHWLSKGGATKRMRFSTVSSIADYIEFTLAAGGHDAS